jgi:hypothetical protein
MSEPLGTTANPPLDYAVAVWVGMPDAEIDRGLREGWIRRPAQAGQRWHHEAAVASDDPGREHEGGEPAWRRWLRQLDPRLGEDELDAFGNEAGSDDARRTHAVSRFVSRVLGGAAEENATAEHVEAALARLGGERRLVRLSGRTASELEAMAREDAGVRRALAGHAPWALTGERAVHAGVDPGGSFDRFDPDTGERLLSDAWIADRARHAAWRLAEGERGVDGAGWRFIDRAAPEASIDVVSSAVDTVHQVIFAREGGDAVSGGGTTDRIHGSRGDDSLRGRGGDDLLEGNAGDDLLQGGAGRDVLNGGPGGDELDGGAGQDRLDGGSGADELVGGRGSDLLRGATGDDVYVFDEGDGTDIVEDDGGTLRIDEIDVQGTMQREGDVWRSSDQSLVFTLAGEGESRVLQVTYGEHDSVALRDWRQGRYGITLQGVDDALASATDGHPVNADAEHHAAEASNGDATRDPFGNEGSTGGPASSGEAGVPDARPSDPQGTVGRPSDTAASPAAFVDWAALRSALDAWTVPMPPERPAAALETAPTAADVADAVSGEPGLDDGGEAGPFLESWGGGTRGRWWQESVIDGPPEVVLRHTR